MKKHKILVSLCLLLTLSACNTIQGFGEDLSSAGQGVSNTAEKTKEKIDGR